MHRSTRLVLGLPAFIAFALLALAAPARAAVNPIPCIGHWVCSENPTLVCSFSSGPSQVCPLDKAQSWTIWEQVNQGHRDFVIDYYGPGCDDRHDFGLKERTWTWTITGPDGTTVASGGGLTASWGNTNPQPGTYHIRWDGVADYDDDICTGQATSYFLWDFSIEAPGIGPITMTSDEVCVDGKTDQTKFLPFTIAADPSKHCVHPVRWVLTDQGGNADVTLLPDTSGAGFLSLTYFATVKIAGTSPAGSRTIHLDVYSAVTGELLGGADSTVTVTAAHWECLRDPKLKLKSKSPNVDIIKFCEGYKGDFSVEVETESKGLKAKYCQGKAIGEPVEFDFDETTYEWGGEAKGNAATAHVEVNGKGKYTVTCKVTRKVKGDCPSSDSVDVTWTIDIDEPHWVCDQPTKLTVSRARPKDGNIKACFEYSDLFAVGYDVVPGTEKLVCQDLVLDHRKITITGVDFTWHGTGKAPAPGNAPFALVDVDGKGQHQVSCDIDVHSDALDCDDPSDTVDWTIDIDGWRCLKDPKAVNTYEEDDKKPDPIVLLHLGRRLTFGIPIRGEIGYEVCGDEQVDAQGNHFYDPIRPVYFDQDKIELSASGDGVTTGTDDDTGIPWVQFDKPGEFQVTVTVSYKLVPEGEDYVCAAPSPNKQTYDVIVAPPELDVDGDNNNGPAAETPPDSGEDDSDSPDPIPDPPKFAKPDQSDAEKQVKNLAPGKFSYLNNGDWDNDGIPDWDDGFDNPRIVDENGAVIPQSAARASASFVPVVLRVPYYPGDDDPEKPKVHFSLGISYIGWRDRGWTSTAYDFDWFWREFPNWPTAVVAPIRLWTKDGGEARLRADIGDGGDLVRYYESYTPQQLNAVRKGVYYEITLYAEQLALGGSRITLSASVPTDSGSDASVMSGITSTIVPTITQSFAQTGAFQPFVITGLGWDRKRYTERDTFYTWTIDASPLSAPDDQQSGQSGATPNKTPCAFVLKPDAPDKPFRWLDGDPRSQRFALGPKDMTIKILGGLVPDPDPFDGDRSIQRTYNVEVPGLSGATADTTVPVWVEVSRPAVTIEPRATQTRPARLGDPAAGGDDSLLGAEAIVHIDANIDLRHRKQFTASGQDGGGADVTGINFSNDEDVTYRYDSPIRGLRYGADGTSLEVMGYKTGAAVVRCDAIIGDETSLAGITYAVLDVPLVVTPVATGEMPDPEDLPTIIDNVKKRRAGDYEHQSETPKGVAPLPTKELIGASLPGGAPLHTDSSRTLYAWYLAALHVAGQVLPQSTQAGVNWEDVFGSDSAAPFGSGIGASDFSANELRAAIAGHDGANARQIQDLFSACAGPVDAWRREDNIIKTFSTASLQRRRALEVRAKHALEFAAIERLKLHFALTRDSADLAKGPWDANQIMGGAVVIRDSHWWESLLHNSSPIEDLFKSLYSSGGITYRVGNPVTEDIVDFMIVERLALARGIFEHLLKAFPPPAQDNADWPFALSALGRTYPGVFVDVPANFEFIPSETTLAAMMADGFPAITGGFYPGDGTWSRTIDGKQVDLIAVGPADGLNRRYADLMLLTLREVYLLKQMQGTTRTAQWWQDFRSQNPVGYTFYIVGDFFFGLQDLQKTITGVDPITGEPLTPAEYAMSAGMTLLNFLPGSAILGAGKKLVGRAVGEAIGKDVLKGAADNIGGGVAKDAAESLAGDAAKATETAGGELAQRRSVGAVEHLGAEGTARALAAAGEVSVDTAEGMFARHGMTSMTESTTVGKSVREAPAPTRRQFSGERGQRYAPPVKDLAKNTAPKTAEECAKLLEVTDQFGQQLAKKDPALYADYLKTTCFPAGTLVVMADGRTRAIEDVRLGDRVLCRPEDAVTPFLTARLVLSTFARDADSVVDVRLDDGGTLVATTEHPVRLADGGWVAVADLGAGDEIVSRGGTRRVVAVSLREQPTRVYNFEVGGAHTYFVLPVGGTEPVWVHNRCQVKPRWAWWRGEAPGRSACELFDRWLTEAEKDAEFAALSEAEKYQAWLGWRNGTRHALSTEIIGVVKRVFSRAAGAITTEGGTARLAREIEEMGSIPRGLRSLWQAHHLIPQAVVEDVVKLFKNKTVTIAGKRVRIPGMGIDVHSWTNGIALPRGKGIAKILGFSVAEHQGYHVVYSKVVKDILLDINKRLDDKLLSVESREAAEAAVRQAGEEVAELQLKLRRLLVAVPPQQALPLYLAGNQSAATLATRWRLALGY